MKNTFKQYNNIFGHPETATNLPLMEFHVSRRLRKQCGFDKRLFATTGNVILANFKDARLFAKKINDTLDPILDGQKMIKASQLNAMGLIDEIFHHMCYLYRTTVAKNSFSELYAFVEKELGKENLLAMLTSFCQEFPPQDVYEEKLTIEQYLAKKQGKIPNTQSTLEEMMLLYLANENPAFEPFSLLFSDDVLALQPHYAILWQKIQDFMKTQASWGPNDTDLITMLREPIEASPDSLKGQLDYIRQHWTSLLGEWVLRLLSGIDFISEEEKPGWSGHFSGPPPMEAYNYDSLMTEYERYSPDKDWMPRVVLMAKTVLVWLDQLSKKYQRSITRLDQIPDEELDTLARQGFTGLWLIGLWQRSWGSKRIKQICGNPEAAASAYSLHDYEIADELGGWPALENLRTRLWRRGIRLASDMVPNHTGLDAKWVVERPDLFLQTKECPFPTYTFTGENLSLDSRISVYLEDHYYQKNDCAVVYKRVDNATGDVRYLYHGNDGTGLPWNDTAQIDFLNPEAREEVIQKILHVARNFPIIRFDAAMVLAKKHIRRLWYPEPGQGGDIASRSEHAISREEFEKRIPNEFWREVVDRCAQEVPDTLLLAEAFWMMEGYFVRTLGMHRVYNSAFMNMLKKEENEKYRYTVKNTLEFDPQVLKRFVNFMNNPDEETAVAQFGKGDKYFGVCTLMVTMPGLPMFGHGQIEGFQEKYGMEYLKAYWDEKPDLDLLERHRQEIFPLMKKRYLFSEIEHFFFYDVWDNGRVNENVFAYSNQYNTEKAIVFYNNAYPQASGWIHHSCKYGVKGENDTITLQTKTLGEALALHPEEDYYCIFQEMHSHQWYIRSSKEICEKGMYVFLNGYESQILMNITEVKDDATEKYKILCDTLQGRGVLDIEKALREIFLKELYEAFSKILNASFFEDIRLLSLPKIQRKEQNSKAKPVSQFLKDNQQTIENFFSVVENFIKGNYGADTIFEQPATEKTKITAQEQAFLWYSEKIGQFYALFEKAQALHKTTKALKSSDAIIMQFYEMLIVRPFMAELISSLLLLLAIKELVDKKATAKNTVDLISLWSLDVKLKEILQDMGITSPDMYTQIRLLLNAFAILDKKEEQSYKEVVFTFLNNFIASKDGATLLGLNQYDEILWFNKEKAEDLQWAIFVIKVITSKKKIDFAELEGILFTLQKAIETSEYKVDTLLAALKPEEVKTTKKVLAKKQTKTT